MLARSVRNPLVVGLGTGAVLVIAAAPPVFANATNPPASAQPQPSGSNLSSPMSPTPPPPVLYITLHRTNRNAIHAGNTVALVAHVYAGTTTSVADVKLSLAADRGAIVDARCTPDTGLCKLGDIDRSGQYVDFTVSIPSKMTSGTVTVGGYAFSSKDNVDRHAKRYPIKVTKAATPKPSKSATPTASRSSGSGSSSGSRVSSGSSSWHSSPAPMGNLNSGTNNQVPSVAPQNSAMLPGIGQQNPGQTPSTAPFMEAAGNSPSMSGTADGPDQLTFDKLASTQAAWLAALLVAFSLLLTQVRLGKANVRATKPAKPKGTHRRTRRRRPGSRAL